jgi:hypothetical protein
VVVSWRHARRGAGAHSVWRLEMHDLVVDGAPVDAPAIV